MAEPEEEKDEEAEEEEDGDGHGEEKDEEEGEDTKDENENEEHVRSDEENGMSLHNGRRNLILLYLGYSTVQYSLVLYSINISRTP